MATKKMYYVKSVHRGHETIYEGTLEYLENQVFGYTLECGNSWNHKIPRYPKTLKSLVKALDDSAYETNHYYDTYYESSKTEFDAAKDKEGVHAYAQEAL